MQSKEQKQFKALRYPPLSLDAYDIARGHLVITTGISEFYSDKEDSEMLDYHNEWEKKED